MDKFVLYYPEGHQAHQQIGHPERPERVEAIRDGLIELDIWQTAPQIKPLELESSFIGTIHTPDYLQRLKQACVRGAMLDADTYTTMESCQLAFNAAGGTAAIAEAVWDKTNQTGFALSRPPGHHATQERGMGFCLINNIAVAAEYLLQYKGAKKLAIVDLDLHHGNGTQDIFWKRSDVSFCSIHQDPFYPGTGIINDSGSEEGEGYTMNLPIPSFSGDQAYLTLLHEIIFPYLGSTEPEMVLLSFGFDTHWKDPLGSMQVSAQCVHQMLKDLKEWVDQNCDGKLAVVLEGGYDLKAAKVSGQAIATALMDLVWQDSLGPSPIPEKDQWIDTLNTARKLWGF